MNYEVIFDAAELGYRTWWFPACGLLFVMVGWGIISYQRQNPSPTRTRWAEVFPYIYIGLAIFFTLVGFAVTFADYWELRQALNSGRFEVVEGKVENFVPMPKRGHAMEQFTVDGHDYRFSDYSITAGFNNTQSHGGPIFEGLNVRIADVHGKIARLEIARLAKENPLQKPNR